MLQGLGGACVTLRHIELYCVIYIFMIFVTCGALRHITYGDLHRATCRALHSATYRALHRATCRALHSAKCRALHCATYGCKFLQMENIQLTFFIISHLFTSINI